MKTVIPVLEGYNKDGEAVFGQRDAGCLKEVFGGEKCTERCEDPRDCSVSPRMPLGSTEKPRGEFLGGESYPGSGEGVKRLHDLLIESTTWYDGKPHLTLEQEDALEWARKFMKDYERKNKK